MQQKLQEPCGKTERIAILVVSCNRKLLKYPYACEVRIFLHWFSYIGKELANDSGTRTLIALIRIIHKLKLNKSIIIKTILT